MYRCGLKEGVIDLCKKLYEGGKILPPEDVATLPADRLQYLLDEGIIVKDEPEAEKEEALPVDVPLVEKPEAVEPKPEPVEEPPAVEPKPVVEPQQNPIAESVKQTGKRGRPKGRRKKKNG